jgi:hypothetical protein
MLGDRATTSARGTRARRAAAALAAAALVVASGAHATGHSGPYGSMSTVPHTPRPMLGTFHGPGGPKPAAPQPGAAAPGVAPALQDQTGETPAAQGIAPPSGGVPQSQAPQGATPPEPAPPAGK